MALQFPFTISATLLVLLVYHWMMFNAGGARAKSNVDAPRTDGPNEYRRIYRAHINTLEHMVPFLVAMWVFAVVVSDLWAAVLGVVWTIGRIVYALGYYAAAEKRFSGLAISFITGMVLILGSLIALLMNVL